MKQRGFFQRDNVPSGGPKDQGKEFTDRERDRPGVQKKGFFFFEAKSRDFRKPLPVLRAVKNSNERPFPFSAITKSTLGCDSMKTAWRTLESREQDRGRGSSFDRVGALKRFPVIRGKKRGDPHKVRFFARDLFGDRFQNQRQNGSSDGRMRKDFYRPGRNSLSDKRALWGGDRSSALVMMIIPDQNLNIRKMFFDRGL